MYYACLCFDVKNIFLHLRACYLFYSILSSLLFVLFLCLFLLRLCHGHGSSDGFTIVSCELFDHSNAGVMWTNLSVGVVSSWEIFAVGRNFALDICESFHLECGLSWRAANWLDAQSVASTSVGLNCKVSFSRLYLRHFVFGRVPLKLITVKIIIKLTASQAFSAYC